MHDLLFSAQLSPEDSTRVGVQVNLSDHKNPATMVNLGTLTMSWDEFLLFRCAVTHGIGNGRVNPIVYLSSGGNKDG